MWASVSSWFTPSVLFCVLNLMIGTIFMTSSLRTREREERKQEGQGYRPELIRAPSILERVRSFNFYVYGPEDSDYTNPLHPECDSNPIKLGRAPSILERVRSFNFSGYTPEDSEDSEHPNPSQPEPDRNPPKLVRAPSILERVRSFNFSLYGSECPDPLQPKTYSADPPHPEAQIHEHHVTRSKSDTTYETPTPAKMKKSGSDYSRFTEAEEGEGRQAATAGEGNQTSSFGEEEAVDAKADDFIKRFKQQLKLQRLDSLLRIRGSGECGSN